MLTTSAEQQRIDKAVIGSYMADYRAQQAYEEWEQRYHGALGRINALYDEFAPNVNTTARMWGGLLGGSIMAYVEMRYGADEQSPKLYSGSYEEDVLAVQHNAAHPWRFMRNAFYYAKLKNAQMGLDKDGRPYYDDDFFLRVPVIASSHDVIMGNRRGNDERQSALFGALLMSRAGCTLNPDEAVIAATEATTWDEKHHRQLSYEGEDFPRYRMAAKVADLLCSHTSFGVFEGIFDITESLTKQRTGRILTLEAKRRGFPLVTATMEERMEFIDSSHELRSMMELLVSNQVDFFQNLTFADPSMAAEFPGHKDNAAFMQNIAREHKDGDITSVQLLQALRSYAAA